MKFQRAFLCAAVCAALATLAACKPQGSAGSVGSADKAAAERAAAIANENADQFIARINKEMHDDYREVTAAQWLGDTYINDDSQIVASKANERSLAKLGEYVEQSRRFDGKPMSADTARAIQLLRLGITMPPPKDPAHLAELTSIGTKMSGAYGAGKWCPDKDNPSTCRDIGQIEDVLADMVKDKSQPMSLRIVGKSMLTAKGWEVLQAMMDRAHGKAKQQVDMAASVSGSVPNITVQVLPPSQNVGG